MVGKRSMSFWGSGNDENAGSRPTTPASPSARLRNGRRQNNDDIESGMGNASNGDAKPRPGLMNGKHSAASLRKQHGNTKPKPKVWRFRDAVNTAMEDRRREELKEAILHGINRDELEDFRKSDEELKEMKNKGVRQFYEKQNDRLNDWLEVDAIVTAVADDVLESMDPDPDNDGDRERGGGLQSMDGNIYEFLPDDEKKRRQKAEWKAKWAININVIANIILLIAKIVAAFFSGSLSLIASLVDSGLDLLCTLIVWSTNRIVSWRLSALQRKFPVGRKRIEPLGILVFSILMVVSFLQILQESVEKIMPLEGTAEALPWIAVGALLGTIVVKGIIWFGCIPIKTTQVQALAQDCKTDVIFNTLSLLFPFIGYKADLWWLDPAGAGLLSLFIIYDWGHTCFDNVTRLSGEAADEQTLKKLMYLAYRFSPVVDGFKSVTAYHAGDSIWVEFDILLKEDTPLSRVHDIVETLQYCCEGLKEVDRCFVSADYSEAGPSGHALDAERT
jgi:cation diffusion facilitator family transporter